MDAWLALEVTRQCVHLNRAGFECGKIERKLERYAFADAAHEIIHRVLFEKSLAKIARPLRKSICVWTVASTFESVTRGAVTKIEPAAIEISATCCGCCHRE
jgi:hypothetical protein